MSEETAVELLKAYGASPLPNMPTLPQLVATWVRDKGFSPEAIMRVASTSLFGRITHHYFMGAAGELLADESRAAMNNIGRNMVGHIERGGPRGIEEYSGEREQNIKIDQALSQTPSKPNKYGQGSSNRFTVIPADLPNSIKAISIAVVGHGAAGILVERTLRSMGFNNIIVYEKNNKGLGIWGQENVYGRSRNNPLLLAWQDTVLQPAPGDGTSVKDFLVKLGAGATVKHSGTVKSIKPGEKFNHRIEFAEDTIETKEFPIVINCSGLGSPRPLDDRHKMRTSVTATRGGERWQRKLEANSCRGKKFVFIGLGNSTAEMLRQIHGFQDQGICIDYEVLTHYPEDSVRNPEDVVEKGDRKYRVFRDISIPDLTSWQGDLSESRYDYFRALRTNKIRAGVTSWTRSGNALVLKTNRGRYERSTISDVDNLFTLIGYAPTLAALESYGIIANRKDNCADLDYDGEVQNGNVDVGQRTHRGYFAMGALTTNPQNKNAIVLPGMLFRLNDLVTSVVLRAAEASLLTS